MIDAIRTVPFRGQKLIDLGAASLETKGGETANDVDGTIPQDKPMAACRTTVPRWGRRQ